MVSQNQMICHFLIFENLVWKEFGEAQVVNFLFKGLVKEWMLVGFKLVFLFSNRRDFFLANLEKVVSFFISLESFSFVNWRKIIIWNFKIRNLDLILVQQLFTLNSFVCCLEWKQWVWMPKLFFWEINRTLEKIWRVNRVSKMTLKVLRSTIHSWFQSRVGLLKLRN